MNPWLLGILALGAFGLATSSSSAPQPAPLGSGTITTSRGGGGGSGALTNANIVAAYKAALKSETDPSRLTSFGNALIAYGYKNQGMALLNKAAHHPLHHHGPSHVTLPPPGTSGWSNPLPKHITPQTAPHGIPGYIGPTAVTRADIQWWVNKYAGTNLAAVTPPTTEQVQDAVAYALKHEKNPQNLVEFAAKVDEFQQKGVFEDPKGRDDLEHAALLPYVKKFAGTDKVTAETAQDAIAGAVKHGSVSDLNAFLFIAQELSTTKSDYLGVNWLAATVQLQQAQTKAIVESSHHAHA